MATRQPKHSEDLNGAPLADVIHSVAVAIADGQFQMDKASLRVTEFMSGQALLRDLDSGKLLTPDGQETNTPTIVDTRIYFGYSYDAGNNRQAAQLSMMELGFVPTFYQFVDTTIDIKLTLRLRKESSDAGAPMDGGIVRRGRAYQPKTVITSTPVDARYSNSYNFSAEMTSTVSTKIVPVPPPPILEERIRILMDQERVARQRSAEISAEQQSRSLSKQPLGGPDFDGAAYYEIGDIALASALVRQAFTVEAWVFSTVNQPRAGIVGAWLEDAKTAMGWLLGLFDNIFGFALSSTSKAEATIIKAQGSFAPGQWHHLAAVYDGAVMRLHVDGQLVNGPGEQSGDIAYPAKGRLLIGGYENQEGVKSFSGRIDEVRLWNRVRTAADIKQAMNSRLTGSEPGLVGYWRLDQGKGDTVPDGVKEKHDAKKKVMN